MATHNLILIQTLCRHYEIEESFLDDLHELGLIEFILEQEARYIQEEQIANLEKMIRLREELNLNTEAIDVVFNLLQKVEDMQSELQTLQNRLRFYEE